MGQLAVSLGTKVLDSVPFFVSPAFEIRLLPPSISLWEKRYFLAFSA
jgi:hypothetical protein